MEHIRFSLKEGIAEDKWELGEDVLTYSEVLMLIGMILVMSMNLVIFRIESSWRVTVAGLQLLLIGHIPFFLKNA